MKQSPSRNCPSGWHLAVIPDGNGRWATSRGLGRSAGHRAGVEAVRRVLRAAPQFGIGTLTLFAFSADNWLRSPGEVRSLLALIEEFLRAESPRFAERGIRVSVIGRRDRLPAGLRAAIQVVESATAAGSLLRLRLGVDYSARDAILRAACRMYTLTQISRESFARLLGGMSQDGAMPDVDLLIRTGGEQRLSDFLLWECAYEELYFTSKLWPDFTAADLEEAIREFQSRERTFGQLPKAAAS
jgi:undecaprenyl diphosphate synthase